jgi:hypothetical protein
MPKIIWCGNNSWDSDTSVNKSFILGVMDGRGTPDVSEAKGIIRYLSLDSWLLHIIPENIRDNIFATLTALFTIAVPMGSGLFAILLNYIRTPVLLCSMGSVIAVGAVIFTLIGKEEKRDDN